MVIACIASVLWANTIFKQHDAVLTKVMANLTHDARMELRNALIFGVLNLFPFDLISKATEKSSCAPHGEAVSFEKWPSLPSK